jgi:signal peptidase I
MEPTLLPAEMVVVNKAVYQRVDLQRLSRLIPFWEVKERRVAHLFHSPKRGEVIVFRPPRDPRRSYVKRVIGLPGDRIEIRDGRVYVNGQLQPEPYITRRDNSDYAPIRLGSGQYFVLGDNRRASDDSRDWGPVPAENVIGKVWFVYWPLSKFSNIGAPETP